MAVPNYDSSSDYPFTESRFLAGMSNFEVRKAIDAYLRDPESIQFSTELEKAVFLNHAHRSLTGDSISIHYTEDDRMSWRFFTGSLKGAGFLINPDAKTGIRPALRDMDTSSDIDGRQTYAGLSMDEKMLRAGVMARTLVNKLCCLYLFDFNLPAEHNGLEIAQLMHENLQMAFSKKGVRRPVQIGIYTALSIDEVLSSYPAGLTTNYADGKDQLMLGPFFYRQKDGNIQGLLEMINTMAEAYLKGLVEDGLQK